MSSTAFRPCPPRSRCASSERRDAPLTRSPDGGRPPAGGLVRVRVRVRVRARARVRVRVRVKG